MSVLTSCQCGHARINHLSRKGGGRCADPVCGCLRFRVTRPGRAERDALIKDVEALPDSTVRVMVLYFLKRLPDEILSK